MVGGGGGGGGRGGSGKRAISSGKYRNIPNRNLDSASTSFQVNVKEAMHILLGQSSSNSQVGNLKLSDFSVVFSLFHVSRLSP